MNDGMDDIQNCSVPANSVTSSKNQSKKLLNKGNKTVIKSKQIKRTVGKREKNCIDNNNNAVVPVDLISKRQKVKISPIIRTHGMKAKAVAEKNKVRVTADELNKFATIDTLTSDKFLGGQDDDQVCHDGIELSVQGSDLEEFPDDAGETAQSDSEIEPGEPGELSSSESEDEEVFHPRKGQPASKVVKPNCASETVIKSRSDKKTDKFQQKFGHLRNDPDFKDFLNEIIDERIGPNDATSSRGEKHVSDTKGGHHKKGSKSQSQKYNDQSQNDNDVINMPREVNHPQYKSPNFKSPSDTTIYTPGLMKCTDDNSVIDKYLIL